jgi:hypothetical protein
MIRIIIALVFCVVLCTLPSHGLVTSSVYSNGGSIIVTSSESWETSDNLLRFGTVNDSYIYGGISQTILTLGRTGIQKTDTTRVETTGMLNAFDSAGMFSTQSNIPESMCDQANFIAGYGNQSSSRLPETQTVEGLWGMMGSGEGTTYESAVTVDDKTVSYSGVGTSPNGYLFEDVKGSLKSGMDTNSSLLQYSYSRHDHARVLLDEAIAPSGAIDWLWNGEEEMPANETVNNTTVEEAQP